MHSNVAPGSFAVNVNVAVVCDVTVAGPPVNVVSGPFASMYTCTRLLLESATDTSPAASITMPDGKLNCAMSSPSDPSLDRKSPPVVIRWMRWLLRSATQIDPSASKSRS